MEARCGAGEASPLAHIEPSAARVGDGLISTYGSGSIQLSLGRMRHCLYPLPNMPMPNRRALALVLGFTLFHVGCHKAKPAATPGPAPAPATPTSGASTAPGSSAPAPTPAGDPGAAIAAATAALQGAVYFEYDQDALSADAQALLDQKLAVLVANPTVDVRVTGHADERGSDEYNLTLGQRRSSTVKRYLTDRGVADTRVNVVSMGEERPACTEVDESCWRRNRRAEFEITSGSVTAAAKR